MDRAAVLKAVTEAAEDRKTVAGAPRRVLTREAVSHIAREFGIDPAGVERLALEGSVTPVRYVRNFDCLDHAQQGRLLGSKVMLAGLGGLGGYVLELLLRAGVGTIVACDGDVFDESNLNRQLLAHEGTVGVSKAEAALERARLVNPSAKVEVHALDADFEGFSGLVRGAAIAVDAMGGPAQRVALEDAAALEGIPLVTAAVSGWNAIAATVEPGSPGLSRLMGGRQDRAAEETEGTMAPAVNLAACLQAAEVLRILTGEAPALSGGLLMASLATMEFHKVPLDFSMQDDG